MRFELTDELTGLIIFAMENQHEEYLLDTETGELFSADELEDADLDEGDLEVRSTDGTARYLPPPEWSPSDGFRLMEQFVETLRNPVYARRLSDALKGGRGVFRRFKDTVKERPEIEQRWYRFKERAMREAVTEWYNELRDTWGLERVAVELPEIEDLVLSDFALRRPEPEEGGFVEALEEAAGTAHAARDRARRAELRLLLEAPDGEVAAVAAAAPAGTTERGLLNVEALYVRPVFRGLGPGRLLLERLVEEAGAAGRGTLGIELAGDGLVLEGTATAIGFRTVAKRVRVDLD